MLRYLAGAQIAYQFEVINSTVWAGQIALLQSVNHQAEGSPLEDLRPFHEIPLSRFTEWRETYSIAATHHDGGKPQGQNQRQGSANEPFNWEISV